MIVFAKTGQKRNYLDALVSSQEYSFTHSPYAMGISSRKKYLLNRVKRIITNENKRLNLLEKAALLAGIILFSAFTYITKEKKETIGAPISIAVEQFTHMHGSGGLDAKKIPADPLPTANNQKKNIQANRSVTDTVPVKKNKQVPVTSDKSDPKLPTDNDWKKAKVLQEIQQVKDRIGAKKESIGKKKEQLELQKGKNEKEEQALKIAIEKERGELEGMRGELDRKRAALEIVKKEQEIEKEKKKEAQKEKEDERENKNENRAKENKERNDGSGNGEGKDNGSGNGGGGNDGVKSDTNRISKPRTSKLFNQPRRTPVFRKPRTALFRKNDTKNTTTTLEVKEIKVDKLEYVPGQAKLDYQPGQQSKIEYTAGKEVKLEYDPHKKMQIEYEPKVPVKVNPPSSPDIKKGPKSPPSMQVKI